MIRIVSMIFFIKIKNHTPHASIIAQEEAMRRESLVNARVAAYTHKKKQGSKIRKDTAINIIRDKTHHKKHC